MTHPERGGWGLSLGFGGSGAVTSSVTLSDEEWEALPPGRHEIALRSTVEVREVMLGGSSRRIIFRAPMTLRDDTEILPAGTPTVRVTTDPAHRAGVEAAVRSSRIEIRHQSNGETHASVRTDVASPPVGIAFDVFARQNGQEWEIGSMSVAAGRSTSYGYGHDNEVARAQPPTVDLIFRPSVERAKATTDVTEIWGEEVVVLSVPVVETWPPGQTPTPPSPPAAGAAAP